LNQSFIWLFGQYSFGYSSFCKQKMRIYAKKANKALVISNNYRIFANEKCVFTQKK